MISIFITAFKEERTIERAIMAFVSQEYEKYELLVAAPDKETEEIVKKLSRKYKQIKFLKDRGGGKPAALNLLFEKAKGNILVLSDGDVFVGKNSLKCILEPFVDKKVGIVSGRPISLNRKNNMLGYWSHLLTDVGAHGTRLKRVKQCKMIVCSGYLYAFRNNLIGKIPEDALSDDALISHLVYEKGYKTAYAPEAVVYVKYPTSLSDWIKQKKRSAGGYNQLKYFIKSKERMRSFQKEAVSVLSIFKYPRNSKEFFWTIALIIVRLYLWILIFLDINIKKKDFKKIWVRVESTK
ncbi:MAG: glycosyltransferase [Candidatus Woesearchaeota archaeon]